MDKTTVYLFIFVAVAAAYFWLRAEYLWRQKLRWYANRIDPIVVISHSERDDMVEIRAEFHREMLRRAGNRWNIPVYARPYADLPISSGKYQDFYCDYLIDCGRFAEETRNQFSLNLKSMDPKAYSEYVIGQRPAMQDLNGFEKK